MTYILKTQDLTKVFSGKEVVSHVNMCVRKGEIYGFLGPNGAGKTTVMKLITNILKPSFGNIEVFGSELTNQSFDILKRMGNIIEYPIFYEKLTARENLELHCQYMGYHQQDAIHEALSMVHLTNINQKSVKNFSLGMKQRLGVARAIITKPELLIMDEPINGLDPVGIKEMRELFRRLCDDYGITILVSSHILSEIEQIADTIGVINNGHLINQVKMKTIKDYKKEYIEIVCSQCHQASFILDNELGIHNFKVMDDKILRIYDTHITQSHIAKTLILNDITIDSIRKKERSLEEYFFDMINGGAIID
ncbi:ABC transporter ATP-binding protein [Vallitalea pronyensis]|uniref:ABC transporter ATP-binding protein n=1 Tax=Vallitalea pronyensis TaxID=1348613 RepID=A0A8J8MKQ9_9FIRM|nr:ABC transporter ATP-binding protein [Vallitalea pronyensis]QUI23316.1 ABC transporter ATP-binding protein [Vallitalea pronyensis]